jgi:hypothetical protein
MQCLCTTKTGINAGLQCPNPAKFPAKNPKYCGKHRACAMPFAGYSGPAQSLKAQFIEKPKPSNVQSREGALRRMAIPLYY